jgi:hypothetical protein
MRAGDSTSSGGATGSSPSGGGATGPGPSGTTGSTAGAATPGGAFDGPILRQETIQARSAEIDTISGATGTSDGYRESLQVAIDAAHLR